MAARVQVVSKSTAVLKNIVRQGMDSDREDGEIVLLRRN